MSGEGRLSVEEERSCSLTSPVKVWTWSSRWPGSLLSCAAQAFGPRRGISRITGGESISLRQSSRFVAGANERLDAVLIDKDAPPPVEAVGFEDAHVTPSSDGVFVHVQNFGCLTKGQPLAPRQGFVDCHLCPLPAITILTDWSSICQEIRSRHDVEVESSQQ